MIRHHVLMRLTDPGLAPEAAERLRALGGRVPSLLGLEVGVDLLRTEASYDLSLVSTHEDLEGLRAYTEHPAHEEFLAWVRPLLAARAVVDAEA